jgi:hypothetical protein
MGCFFTAKFFAEKAAKMKKNKNKNFHFKILQ